MWTGLDRGRGGPENSQICADILYGWPLLRTAEGRSKTDDLLLDQNQTQHGADTFYKYREISISYGCLGLHKKQFNFKKLLDNKQVPYCLEFIQVANPSNKDRLTNQKVIFASVVRW